MTFPSVRSRRRRRRRNIIIAVVLLAVIGAAYVVTRVESDEQIRREYLDLAADVAAKEEDAATRFVSLVVGLGELRRATMVTALEEIEADVADAADLVATIDEPEGDLVAAHLFLRIAASRWRSGVSDARAGMLRLSESALDETGIALVTQGLIDLQVGDSAYAGFLSELESVDTSTLSAELPRVAFVSAEDRELFEPTEVARQIFLTPDLGATLNIAIADLSLDPAALGEQDGLPVIPSGQGLTAIVAVSNAGNTDVEEVLVQLVLVSSDGVRTELDRTVDALAEGELTSLRFEDLPVTAGTIYEITARIEGVDDDPLDDSTSFVFVMDEDI